jgi:hypothetical protein
MNLHHLDWQKVPHWSEILPPNNIIHPTQNKGFGFAIGCFGRVMMSIDLTHTCQYAAHLVTRTRRSA